MTDPRNRRHDRAVREWQRQHPDTTLAQARQAVARRAAQLPAQPERLPAVPQPLPGETLAGYVDRAAAALGTGRHRAMELLGLQPGTSAAARLADLTDHGLPEPAAAALSAAAGITPAQAHALTAPAGRIPPAAQRAAGTGPAGLEQTVRHITEQALDEGKLRPGGADKTSTTMALDYGPRVQLVDLDSQPIAAAPAPPPLVALADLDQPGPAASPWILLDTPPVGPPVADPALLASPDAAPERTVRVGYATTNYGSWYNHTRYTAPGAVVDAFLSSAQEGWADQMTSESLQTIYRGYLDAVDDALPPGVFYAEPEERFLGPAYDADCTWQGELRILPLLQAIDIAEIVTRCAPSFPGPNGLPSGLIAPPMPLHSHELQDRPWHRLPPPGRTHRVGPLERRAMGYRTA